MPRKASSTLPKRSRASKPKVTTGCLTCKIRHLKCDEAHPHCHRCLSTGRTCDGYSPPRPPLLLSSALSTLPTLPGTPLERHSFHHFHTHITPHLHFPFSSPFWSQHVLQASLHEKAIWHAAVALGALHAGEEAFAVRQYVKAIGCLTRMDAGRRVDVALMGCVLFTCFETLRSHHSPALLHLDNGVNLLLELQSPLPAKTSNPTYITPPDKRANPAYPRTPYTPLPTLHTLLTRLDTQATQLLPSRQTRLRPVSVPPLYYEGFASLEEAKGASDELWNYCLYSLQPEPESPSSSPLDLHQYPYQQQKLSLSPTHANLARRQESYTTALSAFLTTHPPRTPREQQAGDILRLHALVATLSLSPASLSAYEKVWEAHTGEFAAIVTLARGIMEADNDTGEVGMGRVSLDTGVLGPLYLVALRCRDPVVREAIALLGREGRKEGLWDSTLLARVAERVVGIEGDSRKAGGGERITDVDVVFDPEGCRAGVRFLMEGGGVAVT